MLRGMALVILSQGVQVAQFRYEDYYRVSTGGADSAVTRADQAVTCADPAMTRADPAVTNADRALPTVAKASFTRQQKR